MSQRLYQVGGVSRPELDELLGKIGGHVKLLGTMHHRFQESDLEFSVIADDVGVLGLLSNQDVDLTSIKWNGSMSVGADADPVNNELYPKRLPLTPDQVRTLASDDAKLYRIGSASRERLDELVGRLRDSGVAAEVVKVAGSKFQGLEPEFTVKTTDQGALGLLADRNLKVGVC